MNYKMLVISFIALIPILAIGSGNTGGGAGKSAGQVRDSGGSFEGELDKSRESALNIVKGQSTDFDHSYADFSKTLKKNVVILEDGRASQIDYKNVDRERLKNYIQTSLQQKKEVVDGWKREKQLAFYFNLYNALTIELILRNYPIDSIKELGSGFPLFQSPWKRKFFFLFGEMSYLDRIEHELTRGNSNLLDPLVHFAFNCASIGCPALLNEAFTPTHLEEQLQKATKNFLRDRSRNYIKGNTLHVSSIFKWYRTDFEKGLRGFNSLKDFFSFYAESLTDTVNHFKMLKAKDYKIKFTEYNWNLNDKK
ncbi:MAG: DUF547 domain-containing protein [Bdellovibrio sp. CG12_big_fil_rev_8_21_14_0_65_39_13]|nr:MAG: DUF547 domain-containing protein [Bdellovibrio sp. CG12_big_fil_rev_8_21_14_0_65_39_13]